ncbi:MAG: ECF-type sigma factor [Planctomycetota bacterium]
MDSSSFPQTSRDQSGMGGYRPTEPSAEVLLGRVREGDRNAAGALFERYRPLIRQRCRAKIRPSLRGVTDSEDLWSTVARRFDAMMAGGGPSVESERAFWVLVGTLIEHAVVDRVRVLRRLERVNSEDEPFAATLRERLERRETSHESEVLDEAFRFLTQPVDRDILTLWLFEHSHKEIAQAVGMTEVGVRVRWHKIRGLLRDHLEGELT